MGYFELISTKVKNISNHEPRGTLADVTESIETVVQLISCRTDRQTGEIVIEFYHNPSMH